MPITPTNAIGNEVRQLIEVQSEMFRQPARLSSSELAEYHYRAERIKQLGQELERISCTAILEKSTTYQSEAE